MNLSVLSYSRPAWQPGFVVFWCTVAVLAIGQDALFSFLKHTAFYWSESVLYKVYWLLFIPQTFLISYTARRWAVTFFVSKNTAIHLGLALLSTFVQIVIFSLLLSGLSEPVLGYPFHFSGVFRKALADDFLTGLLLYSFLVLYFRVPAKHRASTLFSPKVPRSSLESQTDYLTVFLVKDGARTQRIPAETVVWIGTEDSYTVLYSDQKKWLYSASLSILDAQLNPASFIRIHRSAIVNANQVLQVKSRLTGDYDVYLKSGEVLRLSRHYVPGAKGKLL